VRRCSKRRESVGGIQAYIIEQESYPEGMTPMEACKRCLAEVRHGDLDIGYF
jgi:hypothetical protein